VIHRTGHHHLQPPRSAADASLLRASLDANVKLSSRVDRDDAASLSSSSARNGDDGNDDDYEVEVVKERGFSVLSDGATDNGRENNLQHSPGGEDGGSRSGSGDVDKRTCPITSLNEQFLRYLRSLPPIPMKIHTFFPDRDYWRKSADMPFVRHSVLALKDLNPDWNVTVYDDEMIDDVIRRAARSGLIETEEAVILIGRKDDRGNTISHASHIVERSDIARLLLLYLEGGIYIDADKLVNRPVKDVLSPNARLCLPTHFDVNFCQDLMCSPPENDLFLDMIRASSVERLPLERREGWSRGGALFDMGPVLYNRRIFARVFVDDKDDGGKDSWYDDCVDDVSALRELIGGSDGVIATKKDTGCRDGFLVDDKLPACHDRGELFEQYNMAPWAIEVDARWADSRD